MFNISSFIFEFANRICLNSQLYIHILKVFLDHFKLKRQLFLIFCITSRKILNLNIQDQEQLCQKLAETKEHFKCRNKKKSLALGVESAGQLVCLTLVLEKL